MRGEQDATRKTYPEILAKLRTQTAWSTGHRHSLRTGWAVLPMASCITKHTGEVGAQNSAALIYSSEF